MANIQDFTTLTAISPVDGRYRKTTEKLSDYFSEYALIQYRLRIEVEYFIGLCAISLPQLKGIKTTTLEKLREIYTKFTPADARRIKELESVTNHDVKAVEYFIKEKFDKLGLKEYKEFIHFGLTSQDINNTAVPLALRECVEEVILPSLEELLLKIASLSKEWEKIPMLAFTHGQPASPTRLGKEFMVFVERLENQLNAIEGIPVSAKFGGATGNFNAHHVAYPKTDWKKFGNLFLAELGLKRQQYTTQIEHYDDLAELCDGMKRINTICIDMCRDIWSYISMGYFKQKIKEGEVGSSTMPHKVNPIDFENAEGNLGVANAVFEHLAAKLPVSRLQRDLTDSTVIRNLGVPFAHSLIAYASLMKGLNKLLLNKSAIEQDLESNWAVVTEGIQTILRREGYPNPYEALKALTRTNETISQKHIAKFIDGLKVSAAIKAELKKITPQTYTGV
ncbi:MAG TPA: adenylosuccinate lyase [Bacteroidia bacterium]|jgi:adenylosuccinate lyase|nr:adenylosuccinate lyase [Bacteroidia bacterium]